VKFATIKTYLTFRRPFISLQHVGYVCFSYEATTMDDKEH